MAAATRLRWQGGGDIDSVAIAPTGVGFAIETKTRRYDERQLGRVLEQASWLGRRRRRWCSRGRSRSCAWFARRVVERYERGVLVVSIDRLVPVLCEVARRDGASVGAARRIVSAVARCR